MQCEQTQGMIMGDFNLLLYTSDFPNFYHEHNCFNEKIFKNQTTPKLYHPQKNVSQISLFKLTQNRIHFDQMSLLLM